MHLYRLPKQLSKFKLGECLACLHHGQGTKKSLLFLFRMFSIEQVQRLNESSLSLSYFLSHVTNKTPIFVSSQLSVLEFVAPIETGAVGPDIHRVAKIENKQSVKHSFHLNI